MLSALALLAMSCTEARTGETVMSPSVPAGRPAIMISPEPAAVAAMSTASDLEAREEAAIAAILRRVPSDKRAQIEAVLRDPRATPHGSTEPELAVLLRDLATIRAARHPAPSARAPKAERQRVSLALVGSLRRPDARAIVLRVPGDDGIPLVVLPSSAAASDLAFAVRGAKAARARFGRSVSARTELVLRNERALPAGQQERWAPILEELRRAPERQVDSAIGTARVLTVAVP